MSASARLTDPQLVDLILDNVAEGVFTVDSQFRITFFNRAAELITGYDQEQVLGKYCHEVFRTVLCGQDCPLRQSLVTGKTIKNIEIDIRTRSGKSQAISVCTAPLLDRNDRFLGGVETFRDVSVIKQLRKEIKGRYSFQDIISKNPRMQEIFQTLPNIAHSDATVLIQGRSGTGKELFATAIHNLSPRADGPLVTVNCGAVPESLLESELFGHVKGAFTDARETRLGRFQAANGGTIFLDEIGDTPMPMQVKLLRVLERREVQPLGSERSIKVDVRVVAATNQDLRALVLDRRFREDLYYRLNVILIRLPDLHERREDVPLLAQHFIERFNRRMGRDIIEVTDQAMAALLRYPFPGNVRELENVLEHAYIMSPGPRIGIADLPPHLTQGPWQPAPGDPGEGQPTRWTSSSVELERQQLITCLREHSWSIPDAARTLGVHRTTLWRRVKKLSITPE